MHNSHRQFCPDTFIFGRLRPNTRHIHVHTSSPSTLSVVWVLLEDSLRAWTRLLGCSHPEKTSTGAASLGFTGRLSNYSPFPLVSFLAARTADVSLPEHFHDILAILAALCL